MEETKYELNDTVIIDVPVLLSSEDLLAKAQKLAELDTRIDELEQERKNAASQWGAKIKDAQTEQKRYMQMLRTEIEMVSMECYFEPDYNRDEMVYISVETGLEVWCRKLYPEERQLRLDQFNPGDQEESF